jgi:hypothetical protein
MCERDEGMEVAKRSPRRDQDFPPRLSHVKSLGCETLERVSSS